MSRGFSLFRSNDQNSNSPTRRQLRIAAVAAPVVTVAAIGVGIAGTAVPNSPLPGLSAASANDAAAISQTAIVSAERTARISRSFTRSALPQPTGKMWTTRELKLRLTPTEDARDNGDFATMKKIAVTGVTRGDYTQVLVRKRTYWVTSEFLQKKKPTAPEAMGLDFSPCADGSGIERLLQPAAVRVYRAACNAFPELSSYGGQDGHGEHVHGQAIDFMTPSSAVGDRLKAFLYAHHSELDLFDIIWQQRIWTIQRSGEGFRSMSNRGSATANHMDHVHIKVN